MFCWAYLVHTQRHSRNQWQRKRLWEDGKEKRCETRRQDAGYLGTAKQTSYLPSSLRKQSCCNHSTSAIIPHLQSDNTRSVIRHCICPQLGQSLSQSLQAYIHRNTEILYPSTHRKTLHKNRQKHYSKKMKARQLWEIWGCWWERDVLYQTSQRRTKHTCRKAG